MTKSRLPQFMAQDTRVCEEGLLAPKGVKIGTAHADLPHADECLIWSRRLWFLHLEEAQLLRFVQNDCFHTIVTFILQRVQFTPKIAQKPLSFKQGRKCVPCSSPILTISLKRAILKP